MKPLATLAMLILAMPCFSSTPQETLKKRYQEYNADILKSRSKEANSWLQHYCVPQFSYTSYQKAKFDRARYISGVMQQIAQTTKVLKSEVTVRNFEVSKNTVVATVSSDFKGIVVFDGRRLIITDQSVTYDTWTRIGKDWKLQKMVQVNADTQMHQEGED